MLAFLEAEHLQHIGRGLLGIGLLILISLAVSSNRKRFPWKIVVGGLGLQWLLALFILKTSVGEKTFDFLGSIVDTALKAAKAGSNFLFNMLVAPDNQVDWANNVAVIIFSTIVLVSTLSAIGYYFGILQRIVTLMAWIMRKSMGVTGAESLAGAANIFLGQTEAPLLVAPYIPKMTRSELMALMTGGFATVAAGVLGSYVAILSDIDLGTGQPGGMTRHLLAACVMSAPGAFVVAKIMIPPDEELPDEEARAVESTFQSKNFLDVIAEGATQGMHLAFNVLTMLLVFVALVFLVDSALRWFGSLSWIEPVVTAMGMKELSIGGILGLIFYPVAWVIGIEGGDVRNVAALIGKGIAVNEFIAYQELAEMIKADQVSTRSGIIAAYAMCGFANFSSIGIQIGGIGKLAPTRRAEVAQLGPRAMIGGAMACWMTATIAGILI